MVIRQTVKSNVFRPGSLLLLATLNGPVLVGSTFQLARSQGSYVEVDERGNMGLSYASNSAKPLWINTPHI